MCRHSAWNRNLWRWKSKISMLEAPKSKPQGSRFSVHFFKHKIWVRSSQLQAPAECSRCGNEDCCSLFTSVRIEMNSKLQLTFLTNGAPPLPKVAADSLRVNCIPSAWVTYLWRGILAKSWCISIRRGLLTNGVAPNFWQDIRRGSQTFGKTFGVETTKRRGRSNPLPTVGMDEPLGPVGRPLGRPWGRPVGRPIN